MNIYVFFKFKQGNNPKCKNPTDALNDFQKKSDFLREMDQLDKLVKEKEMNSKQIVPVNDLQIQETFRNEILLRKDIFFNKTEVNEVDEKIIDLNNLPKIYNTESKLITDYNYSANESDVILILLS
jgi:hypothetical protein